METTVNLKTTISAQLEIHKNEKIKFLQQVSFWYQCKRHIFKFVFEKYEHIILLRNTGVTIYITGCKFPYVTYVTLVIISQTLQD